MRYQPIRRYVDIAVEPAGAGSVSVVEELFERENGLLVGVTARFDALDDPGQTLNDVIVRVLDTGSVSVEGDLTDGAELYESDVVDGVDHDDVTAFVNDQFTADPSTYRNGMTVVIAATASQAGQHTYRLCLQCLVGVPE